MGLLRAGMRQGGARVHLHLVGQLGAFRGFIPFEGSRGLIASGCRSFMILVMMWSMGGHGWGVGVHCILLGGLLVSIMTTLVVSRGFSGGDRRYWMTVSAGCATGYIIDFLGHQGVQLMGSWDEGSGSGTWIIVGSVRWVMGCNVALVCSKIDMGLVRRWWL